MCSSKERREILHHVLHNIFELDDKAPLVQESVLRKYDIVYCMTKDNIVISTHLALPSMVMVSV